MRISDSIFNLNSFLRVSSASVPRRPEPVPATDRVDPQLGEGTRRRVVELTGALQEIERLLSLPANRGTIGSGPQALSQTDIGLDPSPATAATLQSVEQINTAPTSFSSFGPDWSGTSTALATIGGVYDGSNGNGTLTFESTRDGTHGIDDLKVEIRDPLDDRIQTLTVDKDDPIDQTYTLDNGLTLTLGAGDLLEDETFTVEVSNSVGSQVDPDKPFDGLRNDNPNLDAGQSVAAGAFDANGISIDVYADDSLTDVLSRLTASAAGITASFDVATETVILGQKTPGSAPGIVLANDTSGFLSAMKLDGAAVTPGTDQEADLAMSTLPQFSGVTSGSLIVNGKSIAIDVTTDSLMTVLGAINASGAGVTGSIDAGAQRVLIAADNPKSQLSLDSGTTGFFAGIEIADGTYDPQRSAGGVSKRRSYKTADAIENASAAFSSLFGEKPAGAGSGLEALRSEIQGALTGFFDADQAHRGAGFGMPLDEAKATGDTFEFIDGAPGRKRFTKALQTDLLPVRAFFIGRLANNDDGLIGMLQLVLERNLERLNIQGHTPGILLDTFA